MAEPSLRDIDLYLKRAALGASDPGPVGEGASARAQVVQMEREYPGIRATAHRVATALRGDAGAASAAQPGRGFMDILERGVAHVAESVVADATARVTGTGRYRELRPKEVQILVHECHPDQVCVEVRVNKRMWGRNPNAVLRAIDEEIEKLD